MRSPLKPTPHTYNGHARCFPNYQQLSGDRDSYLDASGSVRIDTEARHEVWATIASWFVRINSVDKQPLSPW